MFKHTVRYQNFFGVESSKTLYFAISKTNMTRMAIEESRLEVGDGDEKEVREGLSKRIQSTVASGSGRDIWDLFQWLLLNAYGEIGEDGETFEQGPEIFEKWTKTASYDAFMSELFESETLSSDFVNSIFPFKVTDDKADPEFARHQEELKKLRNR